MANERIVNLTDTVEDVVVKMSGGNPGAATVLIQVLKSDPLFGLMKVLTFDTFNVWDHRIWMLYKDCCGQNLDYMLKVMDDVGMGVISKATLDHHIDNSIKFVIR